MAKILYVPLEGQDQFEASTKPKAYLSSGYGGGKTYSLCMKGFQLMDINRNMPGGLLCPTTKMYKRDVAPTIREICDDNEIEHTENKSDLYWYFPDTGSVIYVFHAEDEGKSIKGPNLGWGLINEVTLVDKLSFLAFLGRIRLKRSKLLQLGMSGTPEGFNWTYEYFIEDPRKDTDLIFMDSRNNVHNHESYIEILEDSYDPLMQEQYIGGKFVNLTGKRCLYAFNRHKHTDESITRVPGHLVYISIDFNVVPMAATLWNRVPFQFSMATREKGFGHELRGFDQVKLESSDTYELSRVLKEKISQWQDIDLEDVYLYPDPAGGSRSTKTRGPVTDIQILKEQIYGDTELASSHVKYRRKISVRDCLNASNNLISKNRVIVNRKACSEFVADAEQCVFKNGMWEIDKSNLKRTHWLDGFKNMVEYEWPIRAGRGFREERRM